MSRLRCQGFNVFSGWLVSGSLINIKGTSSDFGKSKINYIVKGSVSKPKNISIELFYAY